MFKQWPSNLQPGTDLRDECVPADAQAIHCWKQRLFKNSYTRAGRRFKLRHWSVRIQHAGRRHTFSLRARAKPAAAAEAKLIHETLLGDGWDAALRRNVACREDSGEFHKTDVRYWRQRLLLRRHLHPAPNAAAADLTVRIEHAGLAQFFPLGTSDQDAAADQARRIYQAIIADGWAAACRRFPREVTVGFAWSAKPLIWTYTTLHTILQEPELSGNTQSSAQNPMHPVVLLEPDPGLSRALIWAIQQCAGFVVFACDSPQSFQSVIKHRQPHLILANHLLTESCGLTAGHALTSYRPGVTLLTYSVHVDSDQLFLATPGGMGVYFLNRVEPSGLLAPLENAVDNTELSTMEVSRRVQHYFTGLLEPPAMRGTTGLARLTRRELDVLALLSKGYIDKEVGRALDISTWTVRGHIKKIFERLNVHTRTEAVVQYLER